MNEELLCVFDSILEQLKRIADAMEKQNSNSQSTAPEKEAREQHPGQITTDLVSGTLC